MLGDLIIMDRLEYGLISRFFNPASTDNASDMIALIPKISMGPKS